ncbi:MAG TPA: YIP1 family protein [Dehalococcoidia bacterium]|nr:YIP1 family protein [Dehalococcoidia bacterium]
MIRASRLDVTLYEEVEADRNLTVEALGVVLLGSLAYGLGVGLASEPIALVFGLAGALLSWFAYAGIAYFVGTRVLAEQTTQADWGQLLRAVGYANAPNVLLVTLFIPILGFLVYIGVSVWVLIATVLAVRQALDYRSTGRAIATSAIAWVVQIVIFSVLFAVIV